MPKRKASPDQALMKAITALLGDVGIGGDISFDPNGDMTIGMECPPAPTKPLEGYGDTVVVGDRVQIERGPSHDRWKAIEDGVLEWYKPDRYPKTMSLRLKDVKRNGKIDPNAGPTLMMLFPDDTIHKLG